MAHTTLRDYLQTTEDAISSGRISDALANCQQILQQYPNSLEVQRLLGEVYLAQGELAKAQQAFDWVLINDPENVIAYCSRALISERMSDYDTALDCYQQAYELSRGNSQIRQEFNHLSSKVGQQQFIFSRAGLARLYMRGDLLPQAIQEWETVLNANPERLDARTGLLETYWREGLYDKVEQLAQQILNDVPDCLKALLLLAHVTHAQNMQVAQQLMEHARTLDPNMVMAQDLFSDLMASQVRDPFLSLMKKTPATLGDAQQPQPVANLAETTTSTLNPNGTYSNGTYGNSSHSSSQFSDSLLAWESLDNIIEQQREHQPVQEAPPFSGWDNHTPSELNSWTPPQDEQMPASANNSFEQITPPPVNFESSQEHKEPMLPTGIQTGEQAQQEASDEKTAASLNELDDREQSWSNMETFEMSDYPTWNSMSTEAPAPETTVSWDANSLENDVPAPPAWLEMLTGSGWKSQEEDSAVKEDTTAQPGMSANTPISAENEESAEIAQPIEQAVEAPQNLYPAWEEHFTASEAPKFAQQEDEDFSFGPAWLRSLGATSMDDLLPSEPEIQQNNLSKEPLLQAYVDTSMPSTQSDATDEPYNDQYDSLQEPPVAPIAQDFTLSSGQITQKAVQNDPVMQEPTQQDAFSEKPKTPAEIWLSQAAEMLSQPDQNLTTTLETLENELRTQGFVQLEPGMLSTVAVDQLETQEGEEETPASSAEEMQNSPEDEPLWPAASQASARAGSEVHATPALTSVPLAASVQRPEPTSVAHAYPTQYDPLVDTDLETTMKRPVVRLQAMQPRSSVPHNQPMSKQRSNEQAAPGKTPDGNLSNKERLIRGYQHQLAGSYDDAMQEYRVIIRNAPELLGEVVSDLRALLKLAPRYAPGYRVLGDAYMRQGEYLQAMEAYNKALTMARKAKG
jgi:tetratricopeptide (TPR) repeat protein